MPEKQGTLFPEVPYSAPPGFDLLFKLLRQATSIPVVSDFLKAKNLTHSAGSWEELRDKRLLPALQKSEINLADLIRLLADGEEYGRAHTFLFRTLRREDAAGLIDEEAVQAVAQKLGVATRIGVGKLLDQPEKPEISAIRFEDDIRGKALVIKVVEQRLEYVYKGESQDGDLLTRQWVVTRARAVNVFRLFAFGLLEVRIASHDSKKYDTDLSRLWKLVEPFIPQLKFAEYSLKKAKTSLWEKKDELRSLYIFSNSKLRNTKGSTIHAASGEEEGDLFDDKAVKVGLDGFWKASEAYCESSNVYWLPAKGRLPSKKIHMILPDFRNEFAIPANCSKADYEYVLDQLRALPR